MLLDFTCALCHGFPRRGVDALDHAVEAVRPAGRQMIGQVELRKEFPDIVIEDFFGRLIVLYVKDDGNQAFDDLRIAVPHEVKTR